jgi:hypothetical protein
MLADDAAYDELRAYTLGRRDAAFIHQHVVDAYPVQTATDRERPIRLAKGLIGLYLHVEHGLTVGGSNVSTRSLPTGVPSGRGSRCHRIEGR